MLATAVLVLFAWYAFTPIFPERVTSELHRGMTSPRVQELLGTPQSIRETKSGRTEWRYSSELRADFCVQFDPHGNLVDFYEHD